MSGSYFDEEPDFLLEWQNKTHSCGLFFNSIPKNLIHPEKEHISVKIKIIRCNISI
jgi:hypothetical protein